METRRLGKTDLNLSLIGLGTWAIGGPWKYGWGAQNQSDSVATILEALELGINWIDTAPAYGIGDAETVLAIALSEWRARGGSSPIIATKCGLVGQTDRSVVSCLKYESVIAECEQSLRRLKTDCIDLYQIHWPDPAGDIGEGFRALLDLQRQGKIRWPGVSNFSASQLQHISQYGEVASLQPPYSVLNRAIEEGTLQWCLEQGLGVIPYSPLQSGLLTGKVTRQWLTELSEDDWRKNKCDYFREPKLSRALSFIEGCVNDRVLEGRSIMGLAIDWLLTQPGVTSVICGARYRGQISEMVHASRGQLSTLELDAVDRHYREDFLR